MYHQPRLKQLLEQKSQMSDKKKCVSDEFGRKEAKASSVMVVAFGWLRLPERGGGGGGWGTASAQHYNFSVGFAEKNVCKTIHVLLR